MAHLLVHLLDLEAHEGAGDGYQLQCITLVRV
jgi:hypothetical protein